MMSVPAGSVVGIACGVIFGVIFVVTCIISAIKAVRDRKRIKRRIAERERIKEEAKLITRRQKMEASIEDKQAMLREQLNNDVYNAKPTVNGQPASSTSYSYVETEVEAAPYLAKNGVDNLNFAHSRSDMELASVRTKSDCTAECLPPPPAVTAAAVKSAAFPQKLLVPSKRTRSSDAFDTTPPHHTNLLHLPQECLAVQKILRRHSYEVAVCENSWMPIEPPRFASSRSIIQTYSFGDRSGVRTSTVGFVNRAYDREDHRKS